MGGGGAGRFAKKSTSMGIFFRSDVRVREKDETKRDKIVRLLRIYSYRFILFVLLVFFFSLI